MPPVDAELTGEPVDLAAAEAANPIAASAGVGADPTSAKWDFLVHLDVFDGPFDLLLSLIAKRRLDVTLVAIAQVTDDFVRYLREHGDDWDLDQASEFLVVAATLLDLKVARLLPSAEVDEEDLALLEARDLLFARLLQYKAYKEVAGVFSVQMEAAAKRFPRSVSLEDVFLALLPDVELGVDAHELGRIAARASAPRPVPIVDVAHLHAPVVSVREQAVILAGRLKDAGQSTFRTLVADCPDTMTIVGRFLALLELYREGAVAFEQVEPLGELHVRWVAGDNVSPFLSDDLDESYDVDMSADDDEATDQSAADTSGAQLPEPVEG